MLGGVRAVMVLIWAELQMLNRLSQSGPEEALVFEEVHVWETNYKQQDPDIFICSNCRLMLMIFDLCLIRLYYAWCDFCLFCRMLSHLSVYVGPVSSKLHPRRSFPTPSSTSTSLMLHRPCVLG